MNIEQPSSDFSINQNLGDLIPLSEASRISGLSAGHLRLLVSTGQLWGMKIGRNWLTTNQAIQKYAKEEHKTGPKPKVGN
jgi:hypothetical protein